MDRLATEVNTILARLHTADKVFWGNASDKTAMPYDTFSFMAGGPAIYNGVSQTEDVFVPVTCLVNCWATTPGTASSRMRAVIDAFNTGEWQLSSGSVANVLLMSKVVEVMPEKTAEGQEVWVGRTIWEITASQA